MKGHSYSASTVLNSDSDIGSCYPMSVKEKSRITIRLAYPVFLTGFTVGLNHCGSTEPMINSTDLTIAVEGYQPCWLSLGGEEKKEACEQVGYDNRPIMMGHFDYEANTRSRDTFCVRSHGLNDAPQATSHDDDEEDSEEDGDKGQTIAQLVEEMRPESPDADPEIEQANKVL